MKRTIKLAVAASLSTLVLSGCYVAVAPDGQPYFYPPGVVPVPVSTTPSSASPASSQPSSALPTVLTVRLYPANELATQTGIVTGTVTNMMTGKGRFELNYRGEVLTGEATRVANDERRGVASAYSPAGAYMSCDYQMNTPRQGAGTCTFSNGARYQAHIGS
jgi:hypothetical protein